MGGRGGVEIALGEVGAGRLGFGFAQPGHVELVRGRVGGDQPGAGAAVTLDRSAAALVVDLVADLVGELLDGLDETDVLDFLDEGVDVTALTAAEAVEQAVVGPHVERRRFLVVERAQALHGIGAAALERDVLPHHVLDPDAFAYRCDIAIWDSSGHC